MVFLDRNYDEKEKGGVCPFQGMCQTRFSSITVKLFMVLSSSSFRLALNETQDLNWNLQPYTDIESPTRLDAREHFLQHSRIIWTKEAPNAFELLA